MTKIKPPTTESWKPSHDFAQETSWFEPELLALDQKILDLFIASPVLADYRFHIEKSVRIKKHTLSPKKKNSLQGQEKPCNPPIRLSARSMMPTSNSERLPMKAAKNTLSPMVLTVFICATRIERYAKMPLKHFRENISYENTLANFSMAKFKATFSTPRHATTTPASKLPSSQKISIQRSTTP